VLLRSGRLRKKGGRPGPDSRAVPIPPKRRNLDRAAVTAGRASDRANEIACSEPTAWRLKGSGSDWELDRLGVREEDLLVDVERSSEAKPRQTAWPVMAILVPGERLAP
jgi:hypothetical protein